MVPHFGGQRGVSRPVVVAVVALLVLLVAPAAAVAAVPSWLDRQAGWHGRAIERPLERSAAARLAADSGFGVLSVGPGVGLASPRGSAAVRRVQRVLAELGYAVGPVDGRFGLRTRSAVGWFQRKHGLRIDGVAGPRTLARLRQRARVDSSAGPRARARAESAPRVAAPSAPSGPDQATRAARGASPDALRAADPGDRWWAAALAVAAILAVTLVGLLVRRRRRPAEGTVVSLARPLWVAGVSSDPAVGPFAGSAAALHVSPPGGGGDGEPSIRYCVIDEQRDVAVWVSPQDIRESRGLDERQRRRAADALVEHPAAGGRGGRFARPGARARRAGGRARRRPAGASHLERRVTWFRSLGMPPQAIADLLADEQIAPPPGHDSWTAQAVTQIGQDQQPQPQAPAVIGPPDTPPASDERHDS